MDLRGCVALVSGASGDIGSAIARCLHGAGAHVGLTYCERPQAAAALRESLSTSDTQVITLALDQRDPLSIRQAVQETEAVLGPISILVNNAAWTTNLAFTDLAMLHAMLWDRIMDTNLRGPYLLVRECAGSLRAEGGRVVNVGSLAGLYPSGSNLAYATAKAGLLHLTRCLAVALAPQVLVNCVVPSLVEGTMMAASAPQGVIDSARNATLLGRLPNPAEVAEQVLAYCCTDSFTGHCCAIDGGMPGNMR